MILNTDENISGDKMLAPTEMLASTETLASTKCWRQQNTRVDKVLASTKYLGRQNVGVDRNLASTKCWCMRGSISLLFGLADSTAADFSQTSLMFSCVSQIVFIPPHAVAKYAVASGRPAFMGGLSPALTKYWLLPIFHWFSPNYSSQYLCSQASY